MKLTGAVLLCLGVSAALAQSNLTGIWTADDGGVYYVRQSGNAVWWVGFSSEAGLSDFHRGLKFTNVFHGPIKLVDGRPAVEAQLGTRVQVQLSNNDPLPIALQFAGYRTSWSFRPSS